MKRTFMIGMALLIIFSSFMVSVTVADEDDLVETVFYGQVLDNETLEPIEGAMVYGYDDNFIISSFDETDEEGMYRLDFKIGGVFYIIAGAKEYEQTYVVEDVEINTENEVNFKLEPIKVEEGESRLFGIVTDDETGESMANVEITITKVTVTGNSVYWEFAGRMVTDEDGYYSINLDSANYTVNAWAEGYESWESDLFLLESDVEYELNIQMMIWQQGAFGIVTNEDGESLSDVVVTLEMDWYRGTDVTDENGEYEIRVPYSTTYTLSCHEEGYRPYREDVRIVEEMVEVDIEMTKSIIPDPILQIIYLILELITG